MLRARLPSSAAGSARLWPRAGGRRRPGLQGRCAPRPSRAGLGAARTLALGPRPGPSAPQLPLAPPVGLSPQSPASRQPRVLFLRTFPAEGPWSLVVGPPRRRAGALSLSALPPPPGQRLACSRRSVNSCRMHQHAGGPGWLSAGTGLPGHAEAAVAGPVLGVCGGGGLSPWAPPVEAFCLPSDF